ncbi:MAG: hypothetical protein JNM14_14510 [Ferruginibacter sp.]|nr:hypothetical protein [Ferruginibacter sp.]
MSTNHQVFLSLIIDPFGSEILLEANGPNGTPMPDNTTDVYQGDTVEWLLAENSGIKSIDNIYPTDDVLFSSVPFQALENNWTAVVNANVPPEEKPYTYHIDVTPLPDSDIEPLAENVKVLSFDPKIRVRPSH